MHYSGTSSTNCWRHGRECFTLFNIRRTPKPDSVSDASTGARGKTSVTLLGVSCCWCWCHHKFFAVSIHLSVFSSQTQTKSTTRTPIELVKCKMQVQMLVTPTSSTPRPLPGPISVLMSVIRTTGFRGLWLGHTGTLIRETGGTAAWFGTKEYVASLLVAHRTRHASSSSGKTEATTAGLLPWESALSGACAGAAFNLAMFPADTVKSAMQTEEELRPRVPGAPQGPKATFVSTFRAMYRAQGIPGLYAGCGITVARSIPSSALIFLIYDELKKYFG